MEIKCKHCRKCLLKGESMLLNAHHEVKQYPMHIGCKVNEPDYCSYMTAENIPDWIMNIIDRESWTKGKLPCPHCNNHIGTFNFINELKCYCNTYVTPPIRLVNCKVDILCESTTQ